MEFSAVSLFSGIGGLDIGATFAGIGIATAIDRDPSALLSVEQGLRSPALCADLASLSPEDITNIHIPRAAKVLLIGGPPCTAFSHAGFWIPRKRQGEDQQVGRIGDFVRFLRYFEPYAFLMENVPGLLFKNYRRFFDEFLIEVRYLGYTSVSEVLNAADFGVPQRRRRLFVIGTKSKSPFRFPRPQFSRELHRSSRWAFAGLHDGLNPSEPGEIIRGKYSGVLPGVPPGNNYLYFTAERGCSVPLFRWRSKYWSFLMKLDPDLPSPTVSATRVTNNGPFHWENRHLRLREIARLQTFPDFYPLGEPSLARCHLGNAVPPLLSAQLFVSLVRHLGGEVPPARIELLDAALSSNATFQQVDAALSSSIWVND